MHLDGPDGFQRYCIIKTSYCGFSQRDTVEAQPRMGCIHVQGNYGAASCAGTSNRMFDGMLEQSSLFTEEAHLSGED